MRLVVDTNILIAALVRDSATRNLLTHLDAELFLISFSYEEIEKHQDELLQKAHISEASFKAMLEQLTSKCVILDDKLLISHWEAAKKIMWKIDPNDMPFIAAALAIGADIWSEDIHFTKQSVIRVWSTSELLRK